MMIAANPETIKILNQIEIDDAGGLGAAELRGEKLEKVLQAAGLSDGGSSINYKQEVERLQIQLASTRDAFGKASNAQNTLKLEVQDMAETIKDLNANIERAKELADSRNKIIRSFLEVVNEVGF